MTNERSIVEHAHKIHSIAKELEQSSSDKLIAEGIIAKLSPSSRNFATSAKHKIFLHGSHWYS
jgi:hypothetical protein